MMNDEKKEVEKYFAVEAVKVEARGESSLCKVVTHFGGNADAVLTDGAIVVLHRINGVGNVRGRS